jgi:hypothetical protein
MGLGTNCQSGCLRGLDPQLIEQANSAQVLPPNHLLQYAFASHLFFPQQFPVDSPSFDFALSVISDSDTPQPGEPGSDPLPFLPEPNRLPQILKMPDPIQAAWISCFLKELIGLCFNNQCFKLGEQSCSPYGSLQM